jgi:hypothetical protein
VTIYESTYRTLLKPDKNEKVPKALSYLSLSMLGIHYIITPVAYMRYRGLYKTDTINLNSNQRLMRVLTMYNLNNV